MEPCTHCAQIPRDFWKLGNSAKSAADYSQVKGTCHWSHSVQTMTRDHEGLSSSPAEIIMHASISAQYCGMWRNLSLQNSLNKIAWLHLQKLCVCMYVCLFVCGHIPAKTQQKPPESNQILQAWWYRWLKALSLAVVSLETLGLASRLSSSFLSLALSNWSWVGSWKLCYKHQLIHELEVWPYYCENEKH